jgi:uncharacterized membrane protein
MGQTINSAWGAAMYHEIEGWLAWAVDWLRLCIEGVGVVVIAVGFLLALLGLVRAMLRGHDGSFAEVRLGFARYLVVALEFQLAADIPSTAVAPTWERIGQLAAIAVIRTLLNYFLRVEIREG